MFTHHAPGFAEATGPSPRLVQVIAAPAHEGPVYAADEDALYATSVPRPGPDGPVVDILRLDLDGERFPLGSERLEVLLPDANAANGMTLDREGRLVVCEQGGPTRPARIARVDRAGGAIEPVVGAWGGRPLNSPNDVIVASDGAIWFTDPIYGHLQGFRPTPALGDHVYRHDPDIGVTSVVADELDKPNGIALSPDERYLYVGNWDPERKVIMRYEVLPSGDVGPGAVLYDTTGAPGEDAIDGLKVDRLGNLWFCGPGGVWVLSPDGEHLGTLRLPEAPHNLAWGGEDGGTLYITALTGVYRIRLGVTGARPGPRPATNGGATR
jgi:gluconolactonase